MLKSSIDYLKLKLKYYEWERGCMFHDDSIACSGFFEDEELNDVQFFRGLVIRQLDKEIEKIKKQLTLGESCATINNTIRNNKEKPHDEHI